METEYFYPAETDRNSSKVWAEESALTMEDRARHVARGLLDSHFVEGIPADTDNLIRERFPIRLPKEAMRPGQQQ